PGGARDRGDGGIASGRPPRPSGGPSARRCARLTRATPRVTGFGAPAYAAVDRMDGVSSYFQRLSETVFEPTEHVGGAWNPGEQHIAPVLGLLAHLVETEHRERRAESPLILTRVGYDI